MGRYVLSGPASGAIAVAKHIIRSKSSLTTRVKDERNTSARNSRSYYQVKATDRPTYLPNARDDLFIYLRFWIKTGIVTPRVTSKLERLMREINRRIKKFAFNWSEKGAAIITRIIIKLICSPKDWENYWVQRMKLSGNIKLTFEGIS